MAPFQGNHRNSVIAMLLLLPLAGCMTPGSRLPDTAPTQLPARYSLPVPGERLPQAEAGSIYQEGSGDLYRDGRAHQVGDVILVQIVETSSGSKKASTKTGRESTITGGIGTLFGFEKWLANKNSNFSPSTSELDAKLQNDFNGSGETKRDGNIKATLSARVVEVTMEGNLAIRGFREVKLNNETQYIIVSGIVRPQDVARDNSVLSSHIADARIEYSGTGALADKQQPGWLARGLDVIWPF